MKLKILVTILAISFSCNTISAKLLPADVKKFIERRGNCDHFRGEFSENDNERQTYIYKMANQSCKGTDKELAKLKRKYKTNKQVQKKLREYEVTIE